MELLSGNDAKNMFGQDGASCLSNMCQLMGCQRYIGHAHMFRAKTNIANRPKQRLRRENVATYFSEPTTTHVVSAILDVRFMIFANRRARIVFDVIYNICFGTCKHDVLQNASRTCAHDVCWEKCCCLFIIIVFHRMFAWCLERFHFTCFHDVCFAPNEYQPSSQCAREVRVMICQKKFITCTDVVSAKERVIHKIIILNMSTQCLAHKFTCAHGVCQERNVDSKIGVWQCLHWICMNWWPSKTIQDLITSAGKNRTAGVHVKARFCKNLMVTLWILAELI